MATEERSKKSDIHDGGSAELSKVSDVQEDKDDLKMNPDTLKKIFNNNGGPRATIKIEKENLQMIMKELNLPETTVRQKLIDCDGDATKALRSFLGLI